MGKLIGDVAMTAAQRQQRRRDKLGALRPRPALRVDELLTLDPEAIAARIMMGVPPEKADKIVAALNRRLVHWRVGTFDPHYPYVIGSGARRSWFACDKSPSRIGQSLGAISLRPLTINWSTDNIGIASFRSGTFLLRRPRSVRTISGLDRDASPTMD